MVSLSNHETLPFDKLRASGDNMFFIIDDDLLLFPRGSLQAVN
jgi:hypothetical protein